MPKFLQYLNAKHRNIKFTAEGQKDNVLPFLDIKIECDNGRLHSDIYRKPTFTGLTTKFSSFIPINFKRNLVRTLVTRAFNICSSYFTLHRELEFLKNLLYANGFSRHFCEIYIGKQLSRLLNPVQLTTVRRANLYFYLTFTGKESFHIRNKLNKLVQGFYPQVKVNFVFRPRHLLGNLFRLKDAIPKELQASVVYKYTCNCCKAEYIGKTSRQLRVRIFEHLGRSVRTKRPIAKPSYSAIREHSESLDHPISLHDFSVLATPSPNMDLSLIESLLTLLHKPSIVKHETFADLLCF